MTRSPTIIITVPLYLHTYTYRQLIEYILLRRFS